MLQAALAQAGAGHGQAGGGGGRGGAWASRDWWTSWSRMPTRQAWLVLDSAAVSYGQATPYFPVLDLLRRYCHLEEGEETRTIQREGDGPGAGARSHVPGRAARAPGTAGTRCPRTVPCLQLDAAAAPPAHIHGAQAACCCAKSQRQPVLLVGGGSALAG